MNNNSNTRVLGGKAAEEHNPENFFIQFQVMPPQIQGAPWALVGMSDSGIPIRDYFAAHALASAGSGFESSMEVASWCYRVADAMIRERQRKAHVGE